MDFTTKNFRYVTTEFGDFMKRVKKGDRLYLRALSNKPTEKPAILSEDFPSLATDFVLPPELGLVDERLFSSVLRVSGPVNMWLHYDVSLLLTLPTVIYSFVRVLTIDHLGHGQRILPNRRLEAHDSFPAI